MSPSILRKPRQLDTPNHLPTMAIQTCKTRGKYVAICGQGPSDYDDFAEWLVSQGIDSVSLSPDTVVDTWHSFGVPKTVAV